MILTVDQIRTLIINVRSLTVTPKSGEKEIIYYVLEEPDTVHLVSSKKLLNDLLKIWDASEKKLVTFNNGSVFRKLTLDKTTEVGLILEPTYTRVIKHGVKKTLKSRSKIGGGKIVFFLEDSDDEKEEELVRELPKKGDDSIKDSIRKLISKTNLEDYMERCDVTNPLVKKHAIEVIQKAIKIAFSSYLEDKDV